MRASDVRPRLAAAAVYLVLLAAILLEKVGQTTTDTKAALMVDPGGLLSSTFSLWNPQMSLGELQNQAYGYLLPMGPFFAGLGSVGVPGWVAERLWSWVIVVLACEGARLVCRQLGLTPWAALGAGFVFGLNVRMISEVGVRSAEVLPTAVLPWMLLPILWALRGRIDPRLGALWSVTAYLFSGAVNGTATIAPLPLIAVFIIWGCHRGLVRWSMLGWWSSLVVLASLWWASALVQLSTYSPPFFDYVEDARTTTSVSGFDAALRGASNWVGYLTTAGEPSWPSAWSLNYEPVLVAATGLIAAMSLVGLALFRSRWRTPLVVSALIGLTCLTIGHTSEVLWQSPLSGTVQDALDGPLALLRNIAKIDPVLRLPMAVGFGVALTRIWDASKTFLAKAAPGRAGVLRAGLVGACLLVVVGAQPLLTQNTRTPGWESVPAYWTQTARFLDQQPGQNAAWVVPGAGFGIQTWGWTMDEPMSVVARSPWVTRSQVPLAPPETIRMLTSLEDVLETGSGSSRLGELLTRIGLGFVVLRRDLDPGLDDGIPANLVTTALAKSSGLKRVATFGSLELGPAIEIYEVTGRDRTQRSDLGVLDAGALRTVSSGPADVLASVGAGLVGPDQAAGVVGDPGVSGPAEIVGDSFRQRERQFGRVHATEGPVLGPEEPHRGFRRIENYPGSPGAQAVVADYHGIDYVDASSSQGYPDSLGPIRSETAPYAAVDGDPETEWTSAFGRSPSAQWLEVHYEVPRVVDEIRIAGDSEVKGAGVAAWRIVAGTESVTAQVDPFTGVAVADLGGVVADSLRISVAEVGDRNASVPVSIREVSGAGFPVQRSLVVPTDADAPASAFVFTARPETRACVPTLLGPDCDPARFRPAEESTGIDRLVRFAEDGEWSLAGTVLARSDQSTVRLLDPAGDSVIVRGSSTYYDDPSVSPRMAYDAETTTSWIANAQDPTPTLTLSFSRRTRIETLAVTAPSAPGVVPLTATLVAGNQTRQIRLDGFSRFEPLVTKKLEIRFANPTRPGVPLGVGEIRLGPDQVATPFDGEAPTGVGCGFGPNVYVDSQRYLTKVQGIMGNVAAAGPLALSLCDGPAGTASEIGGKIPIPAGEHRVRVDSTIEFQPVRVQLTAPDRLSTTDARSRSLEVVANSDTEQIAEVGAGAAALLTTARNWNGGWVATLDGKRLPVQRIDGWAQGWQLPAGAGGTVRVYFEPQRAYLIGLIGGLGLVGLLFLTAAYFAVRTRLKPAVDLPLRSSAKYRPTHGPVRGRALRPRSGLLGTAALLVGGALVAGPPGLMGVLVARASGAARRWRLLLSGTLLGTASLVTTVSLWRDGPSAVPEAANVLAAVGAIAVLVIGLSRPEDRGGQR